MKTFICRAFEYYAGSIFTQQKLKGWMGPGRDSKFDIYFFQDCIFFSDITFQSMS